jgi:thymidylate kinase
VEEGNLTEFPPRETAPIICLEGMSAVGKTTLARALAAEYGAAVVPELDGSGAPPISSAEPWFTERHSEQWLRACALRAGAPFVVIDCDVLQGLWYNWMHADQGWPGVDVVGPLYREHVRRGSLAFPDLYVFLDATEAQLWARRDGDPTRTRRGFASHLRTLSAHRRYFAALQEAAPGRVAFVDTQGRTTLVDRVAALIPALPSGPPDSHDLLERMIAWVRTHAPDAPADPRHGAS